MRRISGDGGANRAARFYRSIQFRVKSDRLLDEPFSAFPSWFMWVTCERCGDERMVLDMHAPQRDILDPMRHDGCAGRGVGRTAVDNVSSRPLRRIGTCCSLSSRRRRPRIAGLCAGPPRQR